MVSFHKKPMANDWEGSGTGKDNLKVLLAKLHMMTGFTVAPLGLF
jgi:hypothetical protein